MMNNATPNFFPFDALPPLLFDAVNSVANTTKAPCEMVASLTLAVGAECAQGSFEVEMPQFGPVPLGMNLCLIAESGLGKTQVLNALRKPVRDLERQIREATKAKADENRSRTEAWATVKSQLLKSIRKAIERGRDTVDLEAQLLAHDGLKPPEILVPTLSYSDVTPVAIKMGLAKWPNASLVTDEGSSFFGGGMARDLGFLNQAWDGSTIILDRADHSMSCNVEAPRVTVVVAVQPQAFESYLAKAGDKLRDLGATARFLFCKPLNNQGFRFRAEWEAECLTLGAFETRSTDLLGRSINDWQPIQEKKLLRLDSFARSRFIQFHNHLEQSQQLGGYLFRARDYASKVTRNTMKIAAILHLYGASPDAEISEQTLEAAICISEYFIQEFLAVIVGPPEVPQHLKDADELFTWMDARCRLNNNRYILKCDVQNRCPNRLRPEIVFENAIHNLRLQCRLSVWKEQRIVYYDLCPGLPYDSVALSVAISESRSKRRKSAPQATWYAANVAGAAGVSQLAPPAA